MYARHYIAESFPRLVKLYERMTGKKFDAYEGNKIIGARFPERKSHLEGARFRFEIGARLEQRAD